jgi:hypothetical protein
MHRARRSSADQPVVMLITLAELKGIGGED